MKLVEIKTIYKVVTRNLLFEEEMIDGSKPEFSSADFTNLMDAVNCRRLIENSGGFKNFEGVYTQYQVTAKGINGQNYSANFENLTDAVNCCRLIELKSDDRLLISEENGSQIVGIVKGRQFQFIDKQSFEKVKKLFRKLLNLDNED